MCFPGSIGRNSLQKLDNWHKFSQITRLLIVIVCSLSMASHATRTRMHPSDPALYIPMTNVLTVAESHPVNISRTDHTKAQEYLGKFLVGVIGEKHKFPTTEEPEVQVLPRVQDAANTDTNGRAEVQKEDLHNSVDALKQQILQRWYGDENVVFQNLMREVPWLNKRREIAIYYPVGTIFAAHSRKVHAMLMFHKAMKYAFEQGEDLHKAADQLCRAALQDEYTRPFLNRPDTVVIAGMWEFFCLLILVAAETSSILPEFPKYFTPLVSNSRPATLETYIVMSNWDTVAASQPVAHIGLTDDVQKYVGYFLLAPPLPNAFGLPKQSKVHMLKWNNEVADGLQVHEKDVKAAVEAVKEQILRTWWSSEGKVGFKDLVDEVWWLKEEQREIGIYYPVGTKFAECLGGVTVWLQFTQAPPNRRTLPGVDLYEDATELCSCALQEKYLKEFLKHPATSGISGEGNFLELLILPDINASSFLPT